MGNTIGTMLTRIFNKKKSQPENQAIKHKPSLQMNGRTTTESRNDEKKPETETSFKTGHTPKKESQEDHLEILEIVDDCGVSVSMMIDGNRSVMTCSIGSPSKNGKQNNQKGMLENRDKDLMPLTCLLGPGPKANGESTSRLEQLRKDSPPQTLFRIKGRVSSYDTSRFQKRNKNSKKQYCGYNLFSLKIEHPIDLPRTETGNAEVDDLELNKTLAITDIQKSGPAENLLSEQSTESKSEKE